MERARRFSSAMSPFKGKVLLLERFCKNKEELYLLRRELEMLYYYFPYDERKKQLSTCTKNFL